MEGRGFWFFVTFSFLSATCLYFAVLSTQVDDSEPAVVALLFSGTFFLFLMTLASAVNTIVIAIRERR